MKIHVKRYFDKAAETYDSSADIQKIAAGRLLERIVEANCGTVLEVGTGSGIFTSLFLEKFSPERFFGFDISYPMTKSASRHSGAYCCADGENLPFKDAFADVLVSSSVLQWLARPQESVPAMLKTLKSRGKFYFSVFTEGTFTEMALLYGMTGFGGVYPLRPDSFYAGLFSGIDGVNFEMEICDHVLWFGDVKEFLKKQKNTGAGFTGRKTNAGKNAYRHFCELYPALFGDGETVPVTYRIAYISGQVG
jgi:malonyl-CoA O-methyltransferase